ncbi:unnamed protein product [Didymodactylos carnosus]|uniref:Uncharacterized protein n=1 Tax=Didymodactylos carnosus TaxID=1234261 RepID=A0A8S2F5Q1_9BILA|nr:unnamed protein product [Didymodactylos carnosus]CAF4146084.1 unnamed protein product [Didymodactylos carnosus]
MAERTPTVITVKRPLSIKLIDLGDTEGTIPAERSNEIWRQKSVTVTRIKSTKQILKPEQQQSKEGVVFNNDAEESESALRHNTIREFERNKSQVMTISRKQSSQKTKNGVQTADANCNKDIDSPPSYKDKGLHPELTSEPIAINDILNSILNEKPLLTKVRRHLGDTQGTIPAERSNEIWRSKSVRVTRILISSSEPEQQQSKEGAVFDNDSHVSESALRHNTIREFERNKSQVMAITRKQPSQKTTSNENY